MLITPCLRYLVLLQWSPLLLHVLAVTLFSQTPAVWVVLKLACLCCRVVVLMSICCLHSNGRLKEWYKLHKKIKMHEVCCCRSAGGCGVLAVQMFVRKSHTHTWPLVKVCVPDVGGLLDLPSLTATKEHPGCDCNEDWLQHLLVSALSFSSYYPCTPFLLLCLHIDGLHGLPLVYHCQASPERAHSRQSFDIPHHARFLADSGSFHVFLLTSCTAATHWDTDQMLLWWAGDPEVEVCAA